MGIKEDIFEALSNSVENTSLNTVMDNPSISIASELKEYTTGFEDIDDHLLVYFIDKWKRINRI